MTDKKTLSSIREGMGRKIEPVEEALKQQPSVGRVHSHQLFPNLYLQPDSNRELPLIRSTPYQVACQNERLITNLQVPQLQRLHYWRMHPTSKDIEKFIQQGHFKKFVQIDVRTQPDCTDDCHDRDDASTSEGTFAVPWSVIYPKQLDSLISFHMWSYNKSNFKYSSTTKLRQLNVTSSFVESL